MSKRLSNCRCVPIDHITSSVGLIVAIDAQWRIVVSTKSEFKTESKSSPQTSIQ